jgi:glutamate-1-semialdehyde 2,1-aminomutase
VATLDLVATGEPVERATALCRSVVAGLNEAIRSRELSGWAAYGDASIFHLLVGSELRFAPGELPHDVPTAELKRGGDTRALSLLRLALINRGLDLMRGRSGFLSAAHTEQDLDATVRAFGAALDDVCAEL